MMVYEKEGQAFECLPWIAETFLCLELDYFCETRAIETFP